MALLTGLSALAASTALAAIPLAPSAPAHVAPPSPSTVVTESDYSAQQIDLFVNLRCTGGGNYAWNVAVYDAAPLQTYPIHANYTHYDDLGGGGSFDWDYYGVLSTGYLGTGSSNTFYGEARPGAEVKIDVRAAGAEGSARRTC